MANTNTDGEIKGGARHSASDHAHLQNAIDEIIQAGGNHPRIMPEVVEIPLVPDKTINPDELISFGGEVKAVKMDDGSVKVSGYLVRFSDAASPDLTGDYFTKDTDFGEIGKADVYFNHCMPIEYDGKSVSYEEKIGRAELEIDEVGVLAKAIIYARNEYEKMLGDMCMAGKMGWSSGTAGHLVKRIPMGNTYFIKRWTLGDDASITPTPAEPRNSVIPLKSYLSANTANPAPEGNPEAVKTAESEGKANAESIHPEPIGDTKMEFTTEQLQALVDQASDNAVKKFRESEPATKTAEVKVTKDEADQPWEGAGQFFMAVKNAALYPNQMDRRLLPLKSTGLNEAVPSQGGFLVSPQYAPGILDKVYNTGTVLSLFNRVAIAGNSLTYNVNDETSRATGSRWGGVTAYWVNEGGTKTASKPAFKQLELKLKKLAVLCYATDELLEDESALEGWINNTVPNELRFAAEDAFVEGNGVGKPLGILSSPALISITRNDAAEIDSDDLATMWSRRYVGYNDYVWLGNPQVIGQLLSLTVGQVPVYLPGGMFSGVPYSTLLGRPYYDCEYCPTLGEVGDLILFSPSAYAVIEKAGGIKSAQSPHVAFTTNEMCFRFEMRIDGAPVWASSLTGKDGVTYSPYVSLTTST